MTQRNPDDTDRHIGAEGTEAPGEPRRSGVARPQTREERLDAALACTFPASDPIGSFGEQTPEPEGLPRPVATDR
jgi:hypothetical protein